MRSYREWGERLALFSGVLATWQRLSPQVYLSDPARLAPRHHARTGLRPPGATQLGWRERRALAAGTLPVGEGTAQPGELHEALAAAAAQPAWERFRFDGGTPRVPDGLAEAVRLHAECDAQLTALRQFVPVPENAGPVLEALSADQDTPWRLPRLHELRANFGQFGLGPLLDWICSQEPAPPSPELAVGAFDHAWYASILDQIRVRDRRYAAYPGGALDEIAEDFRRHDVEHLRANRARVRRRWPSGCVTRRSSIRCRPGSSASKPRCGGGTCRCAGCWTRPAMCCSRPSHAGPCRR